MWHYRQGVFASVCRGGDEQWKRQQPGTFLSWPPVRCCSKTAEGLCLWEGGWGHQAPGISSGRSQDCHLTTQTHSHPGASPEPAHSPALFLEIFYCNIVKIIIIMMMIKIIIMYYSNKNIMRKCIKKERKKGHVLNCHENTVTSFSLCNSYAHFMKKKRKLI